MGEPTSLNSQAPKRQARPGAHVARDPGYCGGGHLPRLSRNLRASRLPGWLAALAPGPPVSGLSSLLRKLG